MVDRQTLSALRLGGLVAAARKDLPTGPLPMPGLPSSVHGYHAHPAAWHQARPAYLDLRDVPCAYIEQEHLLVRDGTAAQCEPEDRVEDGTRHQGNDGRPDRRAAAAGGHRRGGRGVCRGISEISVRSL